MDPSRAARRPPSAAELAGALTVLRQTGRAGAGHAPDEEQVRAARAALARLEDVPARLLRATLARPRDRYPALVAGTHTVPERVRDFYHQLSDPTQTPAAVLERVVTATVPRGRPRRVDAAYRQTRAQLRAATRAELDRHAAALEQEVAAHLRAWRAGAPGVSVHLFEVDQAGWRYAPLAELVEHARPGLALPPFGEAGTRTVLLVLPDVVGTAVRRCGHRAFRCARVGPVPAWLAGSADDPAALAADPGGELGTLLAVYARHRAAGAPGGNLGTLAVTVAVAS